jgi:hypothetical protein
MALILGRGVLSVGRKRARRNFPVPSPGAAPPDFTV